MKLDSKIPEGPLSEKWTNYKTKQKLVNPANKRKLDIIVVGTGLAGASAAASLGALGFNVDIFCIQDSPRRVASTPPRTTRTTATALNACSATPSRVAIIVPAKPTSTVWPR